MGCAPRVSPLHSRKPMDKLAFMPLDSVVILQPGLSTWNYLGMSLENYNLAVYEPRKFIAESKLGQIFRDAGIPEERIMKVSTTCLVPRGNEYPENAYEFSSASLRFAQADPLDVHSYDCIKVNSAFYSVFFMVLMDKTNLSDNIDRSLMNVMVVVLYQGRILYYRWHKNSMRAKQKNSERLIFFPDEQINGIMQEATKDILKKLK